MPEPPEVMSSVLIAELYAELIVALASVIALVATAGAGLTRKLSVFDEELTALETALKTTVVVEATLAGAL